MKTCPTSVTLTKMVHAAVQWELQQQAQKMSQLCSEMENNGKLEQLSKSVNLQNHMILDLQRKTDQI